MTPVICFYDDPTYVYSENYQLLSCPEEISVTDFLESISQIYFDKMKIIQINFDSYTELIFKYKPSLYPSAKASVFILNDFRLISLTDIEQLAFNQNSDRPPVQNSLENHLPFQLLMSKSQFLNKVIQIKEMIAAGRFYQVNLTCALQAKLDIDPFIFFMNYYKKYSGQYKSFLPYGNKAIISFSPEMFLHKKKSTLRTQPIKGSISKKSHFENDLLKNKKEEAELSMIVDLLRNDLNSIETKSSSIVTKHREIMSLNYIQHTFSEIEIQTEQTLTTILEKMLPGGSISGCPKKEGLFAISELELYRRGAYTGTIGWWHKNDFKLNIAIRTFIQNKEDYFYFSGGGIVYDSDPEKEFAELLNKTGNLNVQYAYS